MSVVLDASAVLAFLGDEPGADTVEAMLEDDALCGAANWSEVTQKVAAAGHDWNLARALLLSYGLGIEPVIAADVEASSGRIVRNRLNRGGNHQPAARFTCTDHNTGKR